MDELIDKMAQEIVDRVIVQVRSEIAEMKKQTVKICYTESEVAEMLGISKTSLYRARREGKISYCKSLERKIVYLPEHLFDYLKRGEILRTGSRKS